jgi:hypothetical protein
MTWVKDFGSWMNEKFGDDHPKNKFIELPHKDAIKYADDLYDLIQTAYSKKGGNLEIKSAADLKNSDITYWILKDIDSNPDADLTLGGKFTKHGVKMTIMGQDGSSEAKRDVVQKMIELMKTRGFYAELDKDLAQKMGLPAIRNEKEVRNVLNKDITWNNDGSYERDIAGEPHTKVLVGIPR